VENTPPTAPLVALEPAEPTAPSGVSVVIKKPSTDRDGDTVAYRYVWFRGGVQTAYDKAAIPPAVLRHGEAWRVEVTPFDGEETGAPVTASAAVKNTPPPAPTVALVPAAPATAEPVKCEARAPQRDADQEPITLRYRWHLDGRPVAIAEASAALAANVVRRGQKWRCEAWSFDGTAERARLRRAHCAQQRAVRAHARSSRTRRGADAFVCRVETPSADLDDDPVTYAYA
jgi:hypothetical protein